MSAINIALLNIHQGLSNPLETIPYLIALLSDRLATIIEKSTRLLGYFYEKHPTSCVQDYWKESNSPTRFK